MKGMTRPARSAPDVSRPEQRRAQAFKAVIAKDSELTGLMRCAQAGNEYAYTCLLKELFPLIRKMTQRRMSNSASSDHEDLLQEILLSFHVSRTTYDPMRPFIPWLQAIVSNRTIDFVRRRERNNTAQIMPDYLVATIADNVASNTIARFEATNELRSAISRLPNRQRTAIELLKLREMTLREAADLTGISVSALKAAVHRAVAALRDSLAPSHAA